MKRLVALFICTALMCGCSDRHSVKADVHPPANDIHRSVIETLRAKYPRGIPWRVTILDKDGNSIGAMEMLITSERGSSCLGGISDGSVLVEFTKKDGLPSNLHVTSYGAAKFTDNTVEIDLTGGMCDAYLLMSGEIASDGSSTGRIYTLGLRGGRDVGTYRAAVK